MKTIPTTDLHVAPICLGTGEIGSSLDEPESFELLDLFVELGGNFLDTAHVYGSWVPNLESPSEKTIGAWMKARRNRDRIVIGTKGAHPDLKTMHIPRLHSKDIIQDLDESLDHLQTDRIDLYWLHRDDTNHPVEDILETLESQVYAGKIRYYGASNWKTPRLREAWDFARKNGISGFVADQSLWNAAVLSGTPYGDATLGWMDEERFRFHSETGMPMIPYNSQAGGMFHKMDAAPLGANLGCGSFYGVEETKARYARMKELASEKGLSLTQVVLGYLLSQPFLTVPIVGCHTPEQLRDSMPAMDVRLTQEEIRYIESGTL